MCEFLSEAPNEDGAEKTGLKKQWKSCKKSLHESTLCYVSLQKEILSARYIPEKKQKKKLIVLLSFCKSMKYHDKLLNYVDFSVLAIDGRAVGTVNAK